ncbi:hypothetical protein CRE_20605 [Caenorhabditis remanei]|uniref:Uncharacterized protein n=2 Tax=Caenorhabditis remanei TaxID=31234 RepID=E3NKV1_CAERE|nr:hypothetical protein CRE_20605 [Caenorhabditis remanei]
MYTKQISYILEAVDEEEDPEWAAGRGKTLADQERIRQRKAERARKEMEERERKVKEGRDEAPDVERDEPLPSSSTPDLQKTSEESDDLVAPVEEIMEREATPASSSPPETDCSFSLAFVLEAPSESSQHDEAEDSDGAGTIQY